MNNCIARALKYECLLPEAKSQIVCKIVQFQMIRNVSFFCICSMIRTISCCFNYIILSCILHVKYTIFERLPNMKNYLKLYFYELRNYSYLILLVMECE